jgi:hypothetical protein
MHHCWVYIEPGMQHIFMDESGSIGFSAGGTTYFILAFAAPREGKKLSKCIKNFNAHLIREIRSPFWNDGLV